MFKDDEFSLPINEMWNNKDKLSSTTAKTPEKALIRKVLEMLDGGELRIAEPFPGADGKIIWVVNDWAKKAVLLSFRLNDMKLVEGGNDDSTWYDKVPSKFLGWGSLRWREAGFRALPGSIVRHSAFIGKNVVLMPSFVNVGAYVGENTMVDTWATVGSCAQIGKNCHLSGGVGIGGVLEPLQANPTIIEDNCFIGARSEVVEGVIVREGAVLSMGVFIGKNTPIVDRTKDGAITFGEVPARAVVMMGIHPKNGLLCPYIVKYRDEGTDAATALNEMLRD